VKHGIAAGLLVLLLRGSAAAQGQVEMELMTYPEIAAAVSSGKTTVLIYNGGTEQRGPHAVVGGHTFIARRASVEIARQLGNALVAPVLPYSIAGSHLASKWPGTVNLPAPVFSAVNDAVVQSMVVNGFKHLVLMGDHGGGQRELSELARTLDRKYAPHGSHVYFCSDLYAKTDADVAAWLKEHGFPPGTHGAIHDTSVLMFLGGDAYIRKDKLAVGDRSNGVTGDPRPATPELGKLFFDMKVRNAVSQIRSLVAAATKPAE